ncbi:MAG: hypothetical protein H6625_13890 [Bdellovibrionaceae bacterium]|nr:hypothetical protein [Pseudobdellovibrionaceae bacterium]
MSLFILLASSLGMANDDLFSILESSPTEQFAEEYSELEQILRKEIGKVTAEQNIFFSFLRKNEFEKALFQWSAAFANSEYVNTASGQALYSYIIWKNGMAITAMEKLFSIPDLDKIPKMLKQIFRLEAPSEHKVWKTANIQWQPIWRDVFDVNTEVVVLSRQEFDLEKKEEIYETLKKTKLKTSARYWLEWQMALSLSLKGEVVSAAKVLAHLLKEDQNIVSKELITMTAARFLYESGYLDAAIDYYNKIPKSSEYWFEAQEELAWTYMRKGQAQDTLAVAKTQIIEEFAAHTGPEMIFLKALAHLKLCDYKEAAETLFTFKKRFYNRSKTLLKVKEQGLTPATEKIVAELKKGKVSLLSLGPAAMEVPRYLTRDEFLIDLVQTYKELEVEAKMAGQLYARSLTGGTSEVGFQAFLEKFKQNVEKRLQTAKSATYNLVKLRAGEELSEINEILQKMHIVEAELIQQTLMTDRVLASTKNVKSLDKKGTTKTVGKYDLVFPFEGEQWFDELSNFKIDISKACGTKKASAK